MRIGFYPGCSLNGTSREYNESVKALAQAMGLELIELKDWNCCGATAAHSMSKQLSLALPTRVLALAEQQGFQEIVVPCASCYNRLSVVQYELMHNEALKDEILTTVGMRYLGHVKILNVIQMIEKYMLDALKEKIVRPFAHQVHSSSVNIEVLTQVFASHSGTFGVPSGEAVAPWRRPAHDMFRLCLFPKGEVGRIAFFALSVEVTGGI